MTGPVKSPFTATDLMDFEFVSDPQLSPCGETVAYVKTTIDPENNKYRSGIYSVPVPGGDPTPLTSGLYRDQSPRWSPDGEYLAFLSNRTAGPDVEPDKRQEYASQLYILPVRGGEARRVTDLKGGISSFAWSPDGLRIAVEARVESNGPEYLDHTPPGGNEQDGGENEPGDHMERLFEKYNRDVKHIRRVRYRFDGMGYLGEKRSQVFVLDLAVALDVVPGEFADLHQVTTGDFDHSNTTGGNCVPGGRCGPAALLRPLGVFGRRQGGTTEADGQYWPCPRPAVVTRRSPAGVPGTCQGARRSHQYQVVACPG